MSADGNGGNADDVIGYRELTDAAMKGVMREALRKTAELGEVPGSHHFYITFRTSAPGVTMADQLKDRFPEDMTIVIQHQFWDLEVLDDRFEVVLKFAGIPQHLRIPYAAITRFFDPSVNFGFEFTGDAADIPPNTVAPKMPEPSMEEDTETPETSEGTVVSLDAFRRK